MAEDKQESMVTEKRRPKPKNLRTRIGLAVATAVTGAAGFTGPVVAANETPTPIPTRTATPPPKNTPTPTLSAVDRQVAEIKATTAALQNKNEDEKKLADARATLEAAKASGTPGPKINEVVAAIETVVAGREKEKAEATARAVAPTATAAAVKAASEAQVAAAETARQNVREGVERRQNEGGIPGFAWDILKVVGGVATVLGSWLGWLGGRRVYRKIRGGGGGGGAGPVAPAGPPAAPSGPATTPAGPPVPTGPPPPP